MSVDRYPSTVDSLTLTLASPGSAGIHLLPDRVPCSSTCTSHLAHLRASERPCFFLIPKSAFFYFCFCFCFFCVCGLLFYLSISILCYSAPTGICCKLLPNRWSRSRSSLRLGALAGQCQRQPERQCFLCAVQASGRRSSSHPIPPAQREVHNVFLEFDWTHIRFSSPPVTTNESGLSPEVVGGSTGRTGLAACPSYVFGSLASGVLFGFELFDFLIPFQVPGSISGYLSGGLSLSLSLHTDTDTNSVVRFPRSRVYAPLSTPMFASDG